MILRSSERFDDLVDFHLASGTVTYLPRGSDCGPSHGTFAIIDGHFLAVFAAGGALRLWIDSTELMVGADTSTRHVKGDARNLLVISDADRVILSFEYPAPLIEPSLDSDPTPFVDAEDFDFPLFVHNLVSDPERRHVFIEANA